MNNIKTVIKFELLRYFSSPLAYVYLISFLLLSGSCAVYFGHFFANGQANLWSLFDYQPWIYLLFIPAISTRLWAEEFRSKSIVQILTTPVSISDFVYGKFFASWIFSIIAISLTFPFWITINIYGNPDNIVILVNYLGCFVLAGAMLAISQTMSALSKNSVISLVLAVFINLLFFWSGFDYVLFWARELFADVVVDTIMSFSFLYHFSSISRGLLELRDVVFFVSLILFFNITTIIIVSLRTKGSSNLISSSSIFYSIVVFCLFFISFFSVNVVANNVLRQVKYDFTEEKHLTLTKNTKDVLRKLKRPIVAKLYYSPILEKRNPEIRIVFDRIKLMLKQYKSYGGDNFDYKIYTPKFLDKIEDRALADGIQPIPLVDENQNALFGMSFSDTLSNKSVIPFFSLERLPFLEQDLTTNIYKIDNKKKKLGLLSSLPLTGGQIVENVAMNEWEIIRRIKDFYDIHTIKNISDLEQSFDVLMIVHPHHLEDDVIEKIKAHKKVLLVLDVADEASMLYSPEGGKFVSSDLGKLANYWGIDFYGSNVVADFNNSITVDDTINYSKNPSFNQDLLQFNVSSSDFNPNHRTTYKLNNILFSSASIVMPKPDANVLFYPLIKSSNVSALMSDEYAKKHKKPKEIIEDFKPQNNVNVLAAEFLSNDASNPFNIIAVADTDFIYDAYWVKERRFLDKTYYIPIFDSANFVLNSLDYLTKNDDLISLRGKTIKKRPLYKVDNIRKANTYKYKLKESDILRSISGVKQNLVELTAKKSFEGRENFTADELAILGNIRKEMDLLRQQLSDLKYNAYRNLSTLDAKVKFFNICLIPLLIVLIGVFLLLKQKKFYLSKVSLVCILNKRILNLFLWTILVVLLATLSIYLDNKNTISKYEDIPVFKDFSSKINDVSKIKIQTSSDELILEKQNNLWVIKDNSMLPVYQERIKQFLITVNNMRFYEKKSNKVEDLKYFGFSSLKDKNSPMITVLLSDINDNSLAEFDIGWYNLDLGRGAKAAYIKLKNQFQVWLADVDFFDLSLNTNYWTYSSLWNLRFGRFISYNDISDSSQLMNLVKELLNIYVVNVTEDINGKEIEKIHVISENNNDFNLVFYKTTDNKYFVKYEFINFPNGNHFEFFAKHIENKYLEIGESDWKRIKDVINKKP